MGLFILVMAESGFTSAQNRDRSDPSGVQDVVTISEKDLRESSGLALSNRRSAYFWSHNDSGSKSLLYAFDANGKKTGKIRLKSTSSIDWEDMASFTQDGIPRLIVADCGDNRARRDSINLFLFDEPDPRDPEDPKKIQTITVTYSDGPRDCEAIAVDPQRRQIVMLSKSLLPMSGIYITSLPARGKKSSRATAIATRVGTLPLPMVTAMDIQPATGDIWVVSYFQAFRFSASSRNMPVTQQLGRLPTPHELPRWKQIEAVAIDTANNLWLTSEGSPTPLGRLPARLTQAR